MKNLYRLKKDEIGRAGEVFFAAFQEDPVFNAIFDGATREQRLAFFTMTAQYSMKYGQVYAPSPALEGIAAWVEGKYSEMSFWRRLLSGALWTGLNMGMEVSKTMVTVFMPIDQDRKEHMRGRDYIYLLMIGVDPQHQGQGYGGQLLSGLIEESEQTGLPVYLETETENNVSVYEHFGFKVVDKVTLPQIDLPMWELIREPTG